MKNKFKLEELVSFSKGSGLPKAAMDIEGTAFCIHYGELFTRYGSSIAKVKNKTNEIAGTVSQIGDILMPTSDVTPTGLATASVLLVDKVRLGGDILVLRPNLDLVNPSFLAPMIRFQKRKIIPRVSGTSVKHIYAKDLAPIEYFIPSLPEQEKIANFLSALDERIGLQEERIRLLSEQKKGYTQQIFNRQLHFRDDNGNEYPEWEEKKLGDIVSFTRGNNLAKKDLDPQGKFKAVHYGTLFSSPVFLNSKHRTNLKGKKSKKGDILVPASDVTPNGLATASVIFEDGIILGGDINILSPNKGYSSTYIAYLIRALPRKIATHVVGTTVKHIYPNILKNIRYPFPSFAEQEKIATFFLLLDDQIEVETDKLEFYNQEKQGYMQRIFEQ